MPLLAVLLLGIVIGAAVALHVQQWLTERRARQAAADSEAEWAERLRSVTWD